MKHKTTFINEYDNERIIIEANNLISLDEMIEKFETFLIASGFKLKGKLDIVEDNDWNYEEDSELIKEFLKTPNNEEL